MPDKWSSTTPFRLWLKALIKPFGNYNGVFDFIQFLMIFQYLFVGEKNSSNRTWHNQLQPQFKHYAIGTWKAVYCSSVHSKEFSLCFFVLEFSILVKPIISADKISVSNSQLWTFHIWLASSFQCKTKNEHQFYPRNKKTHFLFVIADVDRHSVVSPYRTQFRKHCGKKSSQDF